MSGELLLRHTEPAEPGGHGIHSLRGAQNGDRAPVLGEHRWHHDHLRGLHDYGKDTRVTVAHASRAMAFTCSGDWPHVAARCFAIERLNGKLKREITSERPGI